MELIEHLTIEGPRMVVRPSRELASFMLTDFEVIFPADIDLGAMPRSIAMLPFLWNMAPVVWASNLDFTVDELDHRVARSFDAVRAELRQMYPSVAWRGSIRARSQVEVATQAPTRLTVAALFSGGIDSVWTALRHAGPGLLLITVWGADVPLADERAWRAIETANREFAARHAGELAVVRAGVKEALRYGAVAKLAPGIGSWWAFVQHSMALAGLAGPIVYRHSVPVLYVPATFTAAYTTGWASLPRIDDRISLGTARVIHDSFELSRQQKVAAIVARGRAHGAVPTRLRVCWRLPIPETGNCGRCEKCLRTIVGLLIAGTDPGPYGFSGFRRELLDEIPRMFAGRSFQFKDDEVFMWRDLQAHAAAATELDGPFWTWLKEFDFETYRLDQQSR